MSPAKLVRATTWKLTGQLNCTDCQYLYQREERITEHNMFGKVSSSFTYTDFMTYCALGRNPSLPCRSGASPTILKQPNRCPEYARVTGDNSISRAPLAVMGRDDKLHWTSHPAKAVKAIQKHNKKHLRPKDEFDR